MFVAPCMVGLRNLRIAVRAGWVLVCVLLHHTWLVWGTCVLLYVQGGFQYAFCCIIHGLFEEHAHFCTYKVSFSMRFASPYMVGLKNMRIGICIRFLYVEEHAYGCMYKADFSSGVGVLLLYARNCYFVQGLFPIRNTTSYGFGMNWEVGVLLYRTQLELSLDLAIATPSMVKMGWEVSLPTSCTVGIGWEIGVLVIRIWLGWGVGVGWPTPCSYG